MFPDQMCIALLICPMRVTRHVYTPTSQETHISEHKQKSHLILASFTLDCFKEIYVK